MSKQDAAQLQKINGMRLHDTSAGAPHSKMLISAESEGDVHSCES